MGDAMVRAEFETEMAQGIEDGAARLRKDNSIAAERANEAWLQRRWDEAIEVLLVKYRLHYDAGDMSIAECEEANDRLRKELKELGAAYVREAVGPIATRDDPRERLIGSRSDAAL